MLFAAHLRDYEVVGQYTDKWGHRHDSSRVCDSVDLNAPIKVKVQVAK